MNGPDSTDSDDKSTFERIYSQPGAGWTQQEAPTELRALVESGQVRSAKAIDIGCGEGFNSIYLATHGFDVLGVDFSEQAIAHARRNARAADVDVRFRALAVDALAEIDERFDFVLEWALLHHLAPQVRVAYVRDVADRLRTAGTYLSLCFSDQAPEVKGSGTMFRISPVGTKLYYSSMDELQELFSPHFAINERRPVEIAGPGGIAHLCNLFVMKKAETGL